MAIRRKEQQALPGGGLPVQFVELSERASTLKVYYDYFEVAYETARKAAADYLDAEDCPLTVSVGAGGGIKVPGVCGYSFSQPTRADNALAIQAVIAALKDGSLHPDALTEVIATVNKDGLVKALPKTGPDCLVTSEKVVTTLRVDGAFRRDVVEKIIPQVEAAFAKPAPKAAEVRVVQPGIAAGNRPEDASPAPKNLRAKRLPPFEVKPAKAAKRSKGGKRVEA